jgi:hypothetical protein
MSTIDFIRAGLMDMHGLYDQAVADLTDEQLHWRAGDRGHPAAFVLWHYVRTEDNIINFVLQGRPTVWLEGGYNHKFGLHKAAQGTGMSLKDAQNLRLDDKAAWQRYQQGVWEATARFLAGLTDDDLERKVTVKPLGEMPMLNAIGNMCLTHGYNHLGELQHLRGLMGLKGMPI